MSADENLNGCSLDFTEEPTSDEEAESLFVPVGEEEDETDDEDEPAGPGSPDRGIATRLRRGAVILGTADKPLFNVREIAGWKTNGRDFAGIAPTFAPQGSVNHHTAGAPRTAGNAPSLGAILRGVGAVPGPLSHVLQAYDDTAIVCAAGVANHAGTGGWKTADHNWDMYGLEVEHPGTFLVGKRRVRIMVAIHACLLWRPTGKDLPASMVCQHWEWDLPTNGGEGWKIDFAKNFSTKAQADSFRKMVAADLRKLNQVNAWTVSYLDANRERKPGGSTDPETWVKRHMPAMRRGKVIFTPKRG